MPIHEALANTIIPNKTEAPIPVRTVSTKSVARTSVTNQPPKTEDKQAEVPAPAAESVKLSPQLSAIARKEQAFRQREQALKAREAEVEARLADADKFSALKTKLTAKDYSEVEALGLNYEEYTQYLLAKQNGGPAPETQALKKLEDEITGIKRAQEESANQQYEETVAEYKKEIAAAVAANPDFASIKELGHEEAVLQLILDSWEEDETELSVEQAAKDVEAYLVEEATKMAGLTKVKSKLQPPVEEKKPLPRPGLKTITNDMTVGSEKRPVKPLHTLSDSERYEEARRRVLERRAKQG